MALSKTEIANLALGRVGAKPIMDLDDEDSLTARIVKNVFASTIQEVGRSGEWNCLKERADLPQLSSAPSFGWSYQFQLPTDCLFLVKVNGVDWDNRPGDYAEIEGRKLLSNADTAQIQYIAYKEDANEYDSLFVDAVVTLLASKIAVSIRGSDYTEMAGQLLREYERKFSNARARDAAERKRMQYDPASESRWNKARYGSTAG